MEEKSLQSWEEFKDQINSFQANNDKIKKETECFVSSPIYRGQRNSRWGLETSLERKGYQNFPMKSYDHIISNILSVVRDFKAEFLNHRSDPFVLKYENLISSEENFKRLSYMAYLRHYGFPSPLLDWSRSPYIAAFFAFSNITEGVNEVSIYCFQEHNGEGKSGWVMAPKINEINSLHYETRRHFLQQGQYTLCLKKNDDGAEDIYVNHQEFFETNSEHGDSQDILIKYNIPASEKFKVLKELDLMNINSFSLFNDEEGLMNLLTHRWMDSQVL